MSDPEKWKEFDLAESTLLRLIGCYSKIIDEEESKSTPDMEKVRQWEDEQHALTMLRREMRVDDQETIARIRAKYDPVLLELRQKFSADRQST